MKTHFTQEMTKGVNYVENMITFFFPKCYDNEKVSSKKFEC